MDLPGGGAGIAGAVCVDDPEISFSVLLRFCMYGYRQTYMAMLYCFCRVTVSDN